MEKQIFENTEAPEKTLTTLEGGSGKKLVYTEEFREFMRDYPGYLGHISAAIDAMVEAKMRDFPLREISVYIERKYGGNSPTFKVTLKDVGQSYFVKADKDRGDAEREIMTMEYAKKTLSEFPWVKVPDYQCGYVDGNKKGYYVAKWDDIANEPLGYGMYKWKERFGDDKEAGFLRDSRDKLATIQDRLKPLGFFDITEENVAYDPITGDMMIFDFRLKDEVSPKEMLKTE